MHLIFNDYGSCFVSVRIKKKCCQEHSSLRKQKQEKKTKTKKKRFLKIFILLLCMISRVYLTIKNIFTNNISQSTEGIFITFH